MRIPSPSFLCDELLYHRFMKIVYNFDLEVPDFSQSDFVVSERNSILQITALHNGSTKTRPEGASITRDPERVTLEALDRRNIG
jgi:hypothetical protein